MPRAPCGFRPHDLQAAVAGVGAVARRFSGDVPERSGFFRRCSGDLPLRVGLVGERHASDREAGAFPGAPAPPLVVGLEVGGQRGLGAERWWEILGAAPEPKLRVCGVGRGRDRHFVLSGACTGLVRCLFGGLRVAF